eukprot:EG_transcript_27334
MHVASPPQSTLTIYTDPPPGFKKCGNDFPTQNWGGLLKKVFIPTGYQTPLPGNSLGGTLLHNDATNSTAPRECNFVDVRVPQECKSCPHRAISCLLSKATQ